LGLQVGVDLVAINRVEKILKKYPERFLKRVLSPEERPVFEAKGARLETLAAAFAAKEAVLKAIGCGIGPAALNEVTVLARTGCRPLVKLSGEAKRLAAENKILAITVSMTHEPPFACAIAAATTE
jgi:holo-[acyl-carrier protein] synthase